MIHQQFGIPVCVLAFVFLVPVALIAGLLVLGALAHFFWYIVVGAAVWAVARSTFNTQPVDQDMMRGRKS